MAFSEILPKPIVLAGAVSYQQQSTFVLYYLDGLVIHMYIALEIEQK